MRFGSKLGQMARLGFALVATLASLQLTTAAARAGSKTAALPVSVTVNTDCNISTTIVAFGSPSVYSALTVAATQGQGAITLTCTKGSAPVVALDKGANFASATRNMKNTDPTTTDLLAYNLYQPSATTPNAACAYTTAWGDAGTTITGAKFTPSGAVGIATSNTYNVCATINPGQDVTASVASLSYKDTVTATVTF